METPDLFTAYLGMPQPSQQTGFLKAVDNERRVNRAQCLVEQLPQKGATGLRTCNWSRQGNACTGKCQGGAADSCHGGRAIIRQHIARQPHCEWKHSSPGNDACSHGVCLRHAFWRSHRPDRIQAPACHYRRPGKRIP